MCMDLHVTRNTPLRAGEAMQLSHWLTKLVAPDHLDGRPRGIVIEGDPADRARFITSFCGIPL